MKDRLWKTKKCRSHFFVYSTNSHELPQNGSVFSRWQWLRNSRKPSISSNLRQRLGLWGYVSGRPESTSCQQWRTVSMF